ncbi:regulatory protein RecX [Patulibacter sp.]|uniref:regulatory protein RecX n=1 Tax=Patulibacter sp. TaxID=1912859 RepID=UPI0027230D03|nr:regulatory protein RecX [Patulibacter sp.]MDO9407057.1 regulatory protein RecX [Patulibacter sp.]
MSDGRDAFDEDPAADALPDLVEDGAGWDAPLPDLAEQAQVARVGGRTAAAPGARGSQDVIGADAGGVRSDDAPPADLAGDTGDVPLPDLGGAETDGEDLWAPVPWVPADDPRGPGAEDAPPADLTRRTGRGRRRRRVAGAEAGPSSSSPAVPGPVAASLRRARDLVADDGPTGSRGAADAGHSEAASTDPAPLAADAPRGLAAGGPAGGLEPGTLFSNPDPAPADGERRGRGARRGKKRRGSRSGEGSGDEAAAADGGGGAATSDRPLTAEERLQHALKLAYRHLTKRDRTISEVRAHLEKREVDEASIAGALVELREFGYLDDERYAARFVEDKRRLEGWGHLRIEQGLRRTGVDREIADRAVADDPLRGDEAELAVDALEQRLAGRAPDGDRGRQKALRLLATKGYPLDVAYAAVRAYERRCAERHED